jgi:serine/threonine protein kinase
VWRPPPNGDFDIGSVVAGTHYRVLSLLGTGGMGSVYEVEHVELGKRFVLKALLRELAGREDLVLRLRNEQRALGRLEHPNIVTVTDAGMAKSGIPFFVMERLEGETLGARVRRLGRLPVAEVLALGAGVLDGLSAAHEIGVVHRDVKPQNVFLVGGTRAKILDFGVAKVAAAGNAITARGVAVGTPRYMSPEQASGETVDGRSDLYAVGLLLFEAIAGRGPFDEERDPNAMLLAHVSRRAPALGPLVPGVTRELDELIGGLLAKDPAQRPPTARTAAAALRAVGRRYAGLAALEAPTPVASYAVTTRLFCVPPPREDSLSDDASTLVRDSSPAAEERTWIDEPPSRTTGADVGTSRTELIAVERRNEVTRTSGRLTPLEVSRAVQTVRSVARALRGAVLWRAVWLTLAGAGVGVLVLALLVVLFPR